MPHNRVLTETGGPFAQINGSQLAALGCSAPPNWQADHRPSGKRPFRAKVRAAFCLSGPLLARTIVYIDVFNLYYRALRGTPHKWLDIEAMSHAARHWCTSSRRAGFPQTPSCYVMTGWRRIRASGRQHPVQRSTPMAASVC
jgi:hypothetical protein